MSWLQAALEGTAAVLEGTAAVLVPVLALGVLAVLLYRGLNRWG